MSRDTMSQHKRDVTQLIFITVMVMCAIIYLQQAFIPENPLSWDAYMTEQEHLLSQILAILFMVMIFVLGIGMGFLASHWLQLREMDKLANNVER